MGIHEKDQRSLINKANKLLTGSTARIYIDSASESVVDFYENNRDLIHADVVVVRNKSDESAAASARNSGRKVLLVFADNCIVDRYFSGTCFKLILPAALIKRCG